MKKFVPERSGKTIISIRIPDKLLMQVDENSNKAGISRNEFIKQCIAFALSNMEDTMDVPEEEQ